MNEGSNKTESKFNGDDRVRIWKYKNIFAKGYTINWSEQVFITTRVKSTVPWKYGISELNDQAITGSFYEKELQNPSQENSESKK